MDPREAAAEAATRADAAGRRTKEIADRLTKLASGRQSEPVDVRLAEERADEARQRAEASLERAITGHERAAESHERTAEAHEQAASRGVGNVREHRSRAAQHRRYAQADRDEAAHDRELRERGHQPDALTSDGSLGAP